MVDLRACSKINGRSSAETLPSNKDRSGVNSNIELVDATHLLDVLFERCIYHFVGAKSGESQLEAAASFVHTPVRQELRLHMRCTEG